MSDCPVVKIGTATIKVFAIMNNFSNWLGQVHGLNGIPRFLLTKFITKRDYVKKYATLVFFHQKITNMVHSAGNRVDFFLQARADLPKYISGS